MRLFLWKWANFSREQKKQAKLTKSGRVADLKCAKKRVVKLINQVIGFLSLSCRPFFEESSIINVKLKLLQIGFFLAIQTPALLLAQSDEGDSTPEISISIEDGKVKIAVNLNEPFRWENTRYESIKIFPLPWGGSIPHEIWFEEKGDMTWRQTDMMFMGSYEVIGNSAKNIHEIQAEVLGYVKKHQSGF